MSPGNLGLGQRQRIHRHPPRSLLCAGGDHFHPLTPVPEQRLVLRRAERLVAGPPLRRPWPARGRHGAPRPAGAVRHTAPASELLPSFDQVDRQGTPRQPRQKALRPASDPLRLHPLASPHISEAVKTSRRTCVPTLNPAALVRTIRRPQLRLLHLEARATPTAWTSRPVDGDGSGGKASRVPTSLRKTPPGFPTPPTPSTTTTHPPAQVDSS